MRPGAGPGGAALATLAGRPVSWLRQVHGDRVVVVEDTQRVEGDAGDALVTASPDTVLAVLTADCAPVALGSPEGVVAAVHAGWAGLLAGVVDRAVDAMGRLGASRVEAVVGPCIHAECYEFGLADLQRLAAALGPSVRSTTAGGAPALDLTAAVGAALRRAGASLAGCSTACTACEADLLFSHRARRDEGRQAMLVWARS